MRVVAGQAAAFSAEYVTFARQLGLGGIQFNTPDLPGTDAWSEHDLRSLVEQCVAHGVVLEAIENLPTSFYWDLMVGGPRADEQLTNVRTTIENMGRVGIPVLGMHWLPAGVWRTGLVPVGRGGAVVSVYDHDVASDRSRRGDVWIARREVRGKGKDSWARGLHESDGLTVTRDAMRDNLQRFVRAVVPACERADVRLAFHPDDPPVPVLGGVGRVLGCLDDLQVLLDTVDSAHLGLNLCLGTVSEMGGRDTVLEAIDRFVPTGRVFSVHLRDVQGTFQRFAECFLGEGNFDPVTVLTALRAASYDGIIMDDHTPAVVGDGDYGYRGRAHAIGYIQGIVAALDGEVAR